MASMRRLHASSLAMEAVIVSGTKLARTIKLQVAQKVIELNRESGLTDLPIANNEVSFEQLRFKPQLTIIQVGDRPDSSAYVRSKLKAARSANIESRLLKFGSDMSEEALLEEVDRLNKDPKVHGLLIQLPLPKHIDETRVTNAVATEKDVDGFDRYNAGELSKRGGQPMFKPCTPNGILELIRNTGIEMRGWYTRRSHVAEC